MHVSDEVTSRAVTTWTVESQESHLSSAARRDGERVGFLVHEIRNLVNTAMVSFDVLRLGEAGVTGSTAAVLQRTLMALRALIARSIEEIRSTSSVTDKSYILMTPFIDEVGAGAKLEADSRGLTLALSPVQGDLAVEAERQVLAAVVRNLLQNAFKFTRARSTVTLHVHGSADRVLIEIGDECGGLPGEVEAKELAASFEQRGDDRTGLGVGLAFSRWGVEANGGRLYARNLPGMGCVFTVDLPRCSGASTSTLTTR